MSCPHGNHPDGCELCDELNVLHREIGELQRRAEMAEASATAWNEAATLMKQRATTAEAALEKARENEEIAKCAVALRERMKELQPKLDGVFTFYAVHGMHWPTEDNWKAQIDALDAAIDAARTQAR